MKRKILIILTGLGIAVLGYWGYLQLSGTATFEPPAETAEEVRMPRPAAQQQPGGQTIIHGAEQSYYVTRDPETRQVQRIFGFSRLMNPGSPAARWHVEKPYIIVYEQSYQYRMDADSGQFQIERAGTTVVPRDGRLEGNVTIQIRPHPDTDVAEATLTLDDLMFSSERTEFSTGGPVRLTSDQVDLFGQGLLLMVNAQDGQVEYLQILDLQSLRIKDFADADRSPALASSVDSDAAEAQQTDPPAGIDTAAASSDRARPYQCLLEENVEIRYGDQMVIAGADRVNIQNILFGSRQTGAASPPADDAPSPDGQHTDLPAAIDDTPTPQPPTEQQTERDGSRDVVITCDGGIIFQPMAPDTIDSASMSLAIEMTGMPLRIKQADPHTPETMRPLVQCGLLRYDLAADVLELFTDEAMDAILLGGPTDAGRIEAQGPVVWNRQAQQAQIDGPGVIYLADTDDETASPARVAFAGRMDILFADTPGQSDSPQLAAVHLTGGISAELQTPGQSNASAESAHLAFGPDNVLTTARLEGAVRFEDLDAAAPAAAAAQTAVFHFDDHQRLAGAELRGDVRLDAQNGRLRTEEAFIAFDIDAVGSAGPRHFETLAPATLEMLETDTAQPPSRFEGQSIAYDLQTGSGRATGPMQFVFYQAAGTGSDPATDFWPVQITADGEAEFVADAEGHLESIVLSRNVSGQRTQSFAAYEQTDAFRCDRMEVLLARDSDGQTDIRHIILRDGDVYAESKRTHETLTLAHVRLSCEQILYDRQNDRLVATGPGQIEVDNSQADPTDSPDGIDLGGPSFARIEGFDRIVWSGDEGRITAESPADVLQLAYIPLEGGTPTRMIRAAAGRVEMTIDQDPDGRSRLAALTAEERIFFEEQGEHIFEGYRLVYDTQADGWLTITGTEDRPCMVNGVRVPYIHYNLNTGRLETQLSTIPGAVSGP